MERSNFKTTLQTEMFPDSGSLNALGTKSEPRHRRSFSKTAIIKHLLKPDAKVIWPKEMGIFKQLLIKYPDKEFWKKFTLPFKLNSLCWLITRDGLEAISNAYSLYVLDFKEKPRILMADLKYGLDYLEKNKAPTLKEFLKK